LKDSKKTLENLGANGATMGNVNKSKFEALAVLTPTQDLLKEFHTAVAPMFGLIEVLSRKNVNLRTTRDLLLPKLISGELDVSAMPEPEALAA
jgi:type I restriction enzyme S subunit